MSIFESTYFGLTRVREQSPEARDWAAVDRNPEIISLILKAFEQHAHTGTAGIAYPGYDPTTPIAPELTEHSTGGVIAPGTTVGVRLSYVDNRGLETDASSEEVITLSPSAARPLTPQLVSKQILANALPGGTYIYAVTKRKGSGETPLSDVLPVEIAYDNTYSVTISFDPISSYTDGTDSINIYRSTGLSSSFQLLTTITTVGTTEFTDTNTIPPQNANVQPPTNNTFAADRKVRIDWTAITHPVNATRLRVYVTQQAGLWSEDHLLSEVDLTGTPANYIDYLGSESLGSGWPLNSTQIISAPPKIDLGAETTGAPNLTADMDFNGFKAKEMVLGTTSLSTNGAIWYDSVSQNFKGYMNGAQVVLSPQTVTRNNILNPSFEVSADLWSASISSIATLDRNSSLPAFNGASMGRLLVFNMEAGFTASIRSFTTTSSDPAVNGLVRADSGQIWLARISAMSGQPANTGTFQLFVSFYDSSQALLSEAQVGGTGSTNQASLANSRQNLVGTVTTPASTAYIALTLKITNTGAADVNQAFFLDSAMLTRASSTGFPFINYFDGDSNSSQWLGTPHASVSINGAFQHGIEEAGGHKAENITFGTSNVASVLSRFADSVTGNRVGAQPITTGVGVTAGAPITSTSYTDVDGCSTQITPYYVGQRIELDFYGQFQLSIPEGQTSSTMSIILVVNGATIAITELTQTVVVNNQNLVFSFHFPHTATTVAPTTYKVQAYATQDATITQVGQRRSLSAKLVF